MTVLDNYKYIHFKNSTLIRHILRRNLYKNLAMSMCDNITY